MYGTSEPMLFRDRPSMSIAALLGLAHCQHHSLAYCFVIGLSAVEPCIFLLIMTFSGQRHREQAVFNTVTSPIITTSSSASNRSTALSHRRARHSWAHRPLPFLQLRTRCQLFGRSSPRPSLSSYLCSVISVPCAGRLNAHGTRRSASPPTIRRPLKHSSHHYSDLSLQSSSIFPLSSHAYSSLMIVWAPFNALPLFWSPSFGLGTAVLPFQSPISNTLVPLMQWSTSDSHLFAGKTHQVATRPVC